MLDFCDFQKVHLRMRYETNGLARYPWGVWIILQCWMDSSVTGGYQSVTLKDGIRGKPKNINFKEKKLTRVDISKKWPSKVEIYPCWTFEQCSSEEKRSKTLSLCQKAEMAKMRLWRAHNNYWRVFRKRKSAPNHFKSSTYNVWTGFNRQSEWRKVPATGTDRYHSQNGPQKKKKSINVKELSTPTLISNAGHENITNMFVRVEIILSLKTNKYWLQGMLWKYVLQHKAKKQKMGWQKHTRNVTTRERVDEPSSLIMWSSILHVVWGQKGVEVPWQSKQKSHMSAFHTQKGTKTGFSK